MGIPGLDAWLTTDPDADAPEWCEVCCTGDLDQCVCPECPECGSQGEPTCYVEWEWAFDFSLRPGAGCRVLTFPHVAHVRRAWWERKQEKDAAAEAAWLARIEEDSEEGCG